MQNDHKQHSNHEQMAPSCHEAESVYVSRVWYTAGGILLLLVICLAVIHFSLNWLSGDTPIEHAGQQWQQQQSSPGVAPNQAYDREHIQSREALILRSYAWQDAEHRVARIPVKRAMQLLPQRGLQPFSPDHNGQQEESDQ
ncbi:hypothetical protein [Gimesia sp.]|uniref:hypothetical protein n=1 Tax=Gimesia sp. TaxID=2024833 RepID=UPI000C4DD716|nr:hypothetical protein [Gimesia sp.]MAX34970.1 hypothetical protein [Gimesia sp.]HAH47836.1 hypothetical protein [Planctomycetaceae bacterium]HBL45310.1 hypothetical protein [Planctomycetaceae bacterium]